MINDLKNVLLKRYKFMETKNIPLFGIFAVEE